MFKILVSSCLLLLVANIWLLFTKNFRRWLWFAGAGLFVTVTFAFVWDSIYRKPLRRFSQVFDRPHTGEEAREVCTAWAVLKYRPHDAFIYLNHFGDKSSVLPVIGALEAFPDGGYGCARGHGIYTLRRISNQEVGEDAGAWRKWYEENGHKTQEDWIQEGFVKAGYALEPKGDPANIPILVSVFGDFRWGQNFTSERDEFRPWLLINAEGRLNLYDDELVEEEMGELSIEGPPNSRRGASVYLWRKRLFPVSNNLEPGERKALERLALDSDRSVRMLGEGTLSFMDYRRSKKRPIGQPLAGSVVSFGNWIRDKEIDWGERGTGGFFQANDPPYPIYKAHIRGKNYAPLGEFGGLSWFIDARPQKDGAYSNHHIALVKAYAVPQKKVKYEIDTIHSRMYGGVSWIHDAENEMLYITFKQYTCALSLQDGKKIWERAYGGMYLGQCGDFLILWKHSVPNETFLRILDIKTGKVCLMGMVGQELESPDLGLMKNTIVIHEDNKIVLIPIPVLSE